MSGSEPAFVAELLGPGHDRASFVCESEPLERYLKQQANQDVRKDLTLAYVLVPVNAPSRIAGYYTLCSDSIPADDLPAELIRKLRLPGYEKIPATLIGRLARSLSYKGQGIGELLLSNAFKRAYEASRSAVGSWAVTVDAKDERATRFYSAFGFIPFPDTPRRLYLPMQTIERLLLRP